MKKRCLWTVVISATFIMLCSGNLLSASKSSFSSRYKCQEGYQSEKSPARICPGDAKYICSYSQPAVNPCLDGEYSADWHGVFWCVFPNLTSDEVFALNFECPTGYAKPLIAYDDPPVSILCYLENYEEEMKAICSGGYKSSYHSGKDWCCIPK